MNKNYRIAVINGDGIGHEIVPAGIKVLEAAGLLNDFSISAENFPYGAGNFKKTGQFMPDDGLDRLKNYDAILFGGVGLPEVDDTLPAKEFTFKVRTHFQQYVNYRPVRVFKGVKGPLKSEKAFDFVIIRENTEGEFVQVGNQIMPDTSEGMGIDTSVFTRKGIERIAHYAFKLAQKRKKNVTYVTKSNTLIHSLTYWDRVIEEVAKQYQDIQVNKMYIDNCSANFVLKPELFDVVLTTNMHGDILSDLGGALMGSLGLGGSGNINPEKDFPSMFEPIHGSAPDIAGRGIANPTGTIWSAALLLDHLGEKQAADMILKAIDSTLLSGVKTADLGGSATTNEFTESVIHNLK